MPSGSKAKLGLAAGLLFLAIGGCALSIYTHRAALGALFGSRVEHAGRAAAATEPPIPEPFPMPAERPAANPLLIGAAGADEAGYPRQRPDATALLDRLRFGELDALTATLEGWQRDFEADFHKEQWIGQGIKSFGVVDPSLEPLLDAWVEAHPRSWVPWAARAAHRIERGLFARGEQSARATSERRREAMNDAFAQARLDLDQALERARHVVVVHELAARLALFADDRALLASAIASAQRNCRECVEPRALELMSVEPRWGGSIEQMEASAAEALALADDAPALRALGGHVDYYHCFERALAQDYTGALPFCTTALEHGRRNAYHGLRAKILTRLERYDEAYDELLRALEVNPNVPASWALRGDLDYHRSRDEQPCEKPRSYYHALRLDVASPEANRGRAHAAEVGAWAVFHLGDELGRRRVAYECAQVTAQIDLDPQRIASVRGNGARILEAELLADAGAEARLRATIAAAPMNFDATHDLDVILHARRDLEPIVALWDAYIAAVPDDARAYLERSGAHFNLGHPAEAAADIDRACALHYPSACRERAVLAAIYRQRGWPVPAGWVEGSG
jgi:tetratricopeptide (TPR) repeat protein